jgi:predicted ester cyclase
MPAVAQERNKEIVQRWIDEVFNGGRIESVDELKVSSYLDWTPLPEPYQNVERPVSGIKDALPEWLSSLPDFRFTSRRLTAERDFVVCLGHWQAHHEGTTYKGIAPTGHRLGGTRIDIFRVAGDKMVEHWGCGNELGFLRLVGMLANDAEVPADHAEVAGRFVERVLGRRDLAALVELLDPRAVDHSGLAVSLLALFTGFPDLEIEVTDVTGEGDRVTVGSLISGTHDGPYGGVPPTGRRVSVPRTDLFRVEDGRITESWHDLDEDALRRQIAP